jgi:hypothetical protein
MSLKKNISGGELDVPLLGRIVADGETVEVPDFQADGESLVVWPSNRWEPVAEPKTTAEKTAKSDKNTS